MRFVDLSHTVEHGMVTYPGLPAPVIGDHLSLQTPRPTTTPARRSRSAASRWSRIRGRMSTPRSTATRTAAISPIWTLHRSPTCRQSSAARRTNGGRSARAFGIARGERSRRAGADRLGPALARTRLLPGAPVPDARRGRVAAGPGRRAGRHRFAEHRRQDGARPVHTVLLGAGIPVVEHLRGLDALPDEGFRFYAVPVKLRGVGSFPVRAFGLLDT